MPTDVLIYFSYLETYFISTHSVNLKFCLQLSLSLIRRHLTEGALTGSFQLLKAANTKLYISVLYTFISNVATTSQAYIFLYITHHSLRKRRLFSGELTDKKKIFFSFCVIFFIDNGVYLADFRNTRWCEIITLCITRSWMPSPKKQF